MLSALLSHVDCPISLEAVYNYHISYISRVKKKAGPLQATEPLGGTERAVKLD